MNNITGEEYDVEINCIDLTNNEIKFKMLIFIDDSEIVILKAKNNDSYYESKAEDIFTAFQKLKDILLENNIGMQCYGSMENVYPSPMMRTGEKAYVLEIGKKALLKDIVNIFDYVETNKFSTSKEQDDYYNKWLKSIIEK